MTEGYIKLHRSLLKNPIVSKSEYFHLWTVLLLKANHKENYQLFKNEKITLSAGQLITGRKALSQETKITESQIYKILKYLEKEQRILIESNNRFSIITILNWEKYQGNGTTDLDEKEQPSNSEVTAKEQPSNTYKNDKNVKNEKNEDIIPRDVLPKKQKSEEKPKINYNKESMKWENVTNEDLTLWAQAFPACDLKTEFAKMKAWLISNPTKAHKSNWRKFINGWLTRAQDRGGTKNNGNN